MAADRRMMAHPVSDDWPRPGRWEGLQYATAVVVEAFLLGAIAFAFLVALPFIGLVLGAAVGVDVTAVP